MPGFFLTYKLYRHLVSVPPCIVSMSARTAKENITNENLKHCTFHNIISLSKYTGIKNIQFLYMFLTSASLTH